VDKLSLISAEWVVLFVGIAIIWFVILRRTQNTTAPQIFVTLLFPTVLILASLFAHRLKSIGLSPTGVHITNFEVVKEAAAMSIKNNLALAEKITSKKGSQAIEEAYNRIESTKSLHELKQVYPYDIYFHPVLNGDQIELVPVSATK